MYKVYYGISNKLMDLVFSINDSERYPRTRDFTTRKINTVSHAIHTLVFLGPKIWDLVPVEFKSFSLSKFTKKVSFEFLASFAF